MTSLIRPTILCHRFKQHSNDSLANRNFETYDTPHLFLRLELSRFTNKRLHQPLSCLPLLIWLLLFSLSRYFSVFVSLFLFQGYQESVPLITKYLWRKGYLRIPDTCSTEGDGQECLTSCPSELYTSRDMTPYDVLMDVHALMWSAHTTTGTLVRKISPKRLENWLRHKI